MSFSDYIQLSLDKSSWETHADEVNDAIHQKMAKVVERNLRGSVDFGIDPRAAHKAQAIRVEAEGNRLVVRAEDQAAVLGRGGAEPEEGINMQDLFTMSSGIPSIEVDNVGARRLVYRSISVDQLFEGERKKSRNRSVERTIVESAKSDLGRVINESIDEVERRHPGAK